MMAQEFRYPLTRICLRSGTLTLPMALLEVFQEDGDVSVHDTVRGTELVVRVDGREGGGLESYLEAHALEVNDAIVVKVLDDGGIGFTAEKRARRPDYRRPEVLGRLLDDVIEAGVPMTEGEIRALHPDLPSGFPLREALEGESRLTLHQGRWRSTLALEEEQRAAERLAEQRRAEAERRAEAAVKAAEEREAVRRESERRAAEEREAERRAAERHEAERRREAARASQREAAERQASERASAKRDAAERTAAQGSQQERSEQGRREPMAAAAADAAAADAAATEARSTTDVAAPEAASEGADAERRAVERASRERLAEHAEEDARAIARREREARADARAAERGAAGEADDDTERFDWNEPVARGFRFPWQRGKSKSAKTEGAREAGARKERDKDRDGDRNGDRNGDKNKDPFRLDRLGEARPSTTRASVVPAPRPGLFPGDTALNSASMPPGDPKKSKRAREAFAGLGYRIEGLAHGQLMLHADLGRRQYRVLLHVLPDGERLDWAALLARRRDSGAVYLAVLGDHSDLHRLTAPADLARATLWSWAGLERVLELSKTVMLGPVDLEPHFERDGVFEYGLERFERTIAKRVQERGVVSAVLTRLAGLRAPTVFLVDDIVGEPDVPRDQIVRVLERLAEAPFHLISKVDSGEFCLRYRVQDALEQVADYATSLRARLPERQRERVRGFDDDGLAAAFDPIAGDEVDLADVPVPAPSPAPPQPMPSPERLAQATASGGLRVVREERGAPGGAADASGAATGATGASGAGTSADATSEAMAKNAATNRAGDHAPESDASSHGTTSRRGQDALFGEGFGGGGFGEEPVDEVDVSEVIKPKTRGRKRG